MQELLQAVNALLIEIFVDVMSFMQACIGVAFRRDRDNCDLSFLFYLYYLLVVVYYESVETFMRRLNCLFHLVPFLQAFSESRSGVLAQNYAKAHETMCYLRILQLIDFELIQETARAYAQALYFLNCPKIKES